MTYCEKCGNELNGNSKFCDSCGNKIKQDHSNPNNKTKCSKCNSKIIKGTKFCEKCGTDLRKFKPIEEYKKSTPRKFNISIWTIIGILLLITLVVLLPTKVESYTVEVPYEELEEYVERVPYETTEPVVESVPVQEEKEYLDEECSQVSLTYTYEWVECVSSGYFQDGKSTVKITNTDDYSGAFIINIGYNSDSGQFVYTTQSKTISARTSTTFTYTPTPQSFGQCAFTFQSLPKKTECQPVTKTRTETVYKQVIKQETVTKYRDETRYRKVQKVSVETKYKEVNWLFGFDAIIMFRKLS